jgi:hypothetical protein
MLKSFSAMMLAVFVCAFSAFGQETTSVSSKFGSAKPSSSAQTTADDAGKFQVDFHFTDIYNKKNRLSGNDANRPGFGARFGYDVAKFGGGKYVATAEAELNYSPKNARTFRIVNLGSNLTTVDTRTDGRVLQGLFGLKLGRKFDKFGVFGKAKTGFVQYTNGKIVGTGLSRRADNSYNLAGDLGGVVEFYPTKRFVTRFDFGDTIVRIGKQSYSTSVNTPTGAVTRTVNFATRTQHNFQFSAGFGFRF